jgi:DNA-binding Lrp family transcriptional regulator
VAHATVIRCSSVGGDIDVIVETRTPDVDSLNRLRDEIAGYPHVVDLTTRLILKRDKDTSGAPAQA